MRGPYVLKMRTTRTCARACLGAGYRAAGERTPLAGRHATVVSGCGALCRVQPTAQRCRRSPRKAVWLVARPARSRLALSAWRLSHWTSARALGTAQSLSCRPAHVRSRRRAPPCRARAGSQRSGTPPRACPRRSSCARRCSSHCPSTTPSAGAPAGPRIPAPQARAWERRRGELRGTSARSSRRVYARTFTAGGSGSRRAHLAGAGEQEARARALRQAQHVHRPQKAGLDRLDGVVPALPGRFRHCAKKRGFPTRQAGGALVVNRRGWAREVEDLVHLQQDLLHDVVANELKVGLAKQVRDVLLAAREKVVNADHLLARARRAACQLAPTLRPGRVLAVCSYGSRRTGWRPLTWSPLSTRYVQR